ncbi:MAG: hypothetical protein OXC96_10625 [Cyanobacteria bacterium MAG CAR1_bin_15]|nr:hypothetical protein [Cyanobacteria bacterium MAG CAR1_bin_15]
MSLNPAPTSLAYTVSGAAIAGTYTTLSGSVAVAAGVSNVAIPVTIIAVGVGERERQGGGRPATRRPGGYGWPRQHWPPLRGQPGLWLPRRQRPAHPDPGLALALAPDSRTYGLFWAVAPYSEQGQTVPWAVALEVERQEYSSTATAEHSLRLSFSTLF